MADITKSAPNHHPIGAIPAQHIDPGNPNASAPLFRCSRQLQRRAVRGPDRHAHRYIVQVA
ncbi:hypothetical protein [Paracoccus sp. Ld10]|uniref:hypothetical protein n=1 Tax=Paracoccus sp. Ld10 TaxID=649158 RepID=UPI0038645B57